MSTISEHMQDFSSNATVHTTPVAIAGMLSDETYKGLNENTQFRLALRYLDKIVYAERFESLSQFFCTKTFNAWEEDYKVDFAKEWFTFAYLGSKKYRSPNLNYYNFYKKLISFPFFCKLNASNQKDLFLKFFTNGRNLLLDRQKIVKDFVKTDIFKSWDLKLKESFLDFASRLFKGDESKKFVKQNSLRFVKTTTLNVEDNLSSLEKLDKALSVSAKQYAGFSHTLCLPDLSELKPHHQKEFCSNILSCVDDHAAMDLFYEVSGSVCFNDWDSDNQKDFFLEILKAVPSEKHSEFFEQVIDGMYFSLWPWHIQKDFLIESIDLASEDNQVDFLLKFFSNSYFSSWMTKDKEKFMDFTAKKLTDYNKPIVIAQKSEVFVIVPEFSMMQNIPLVFFFNENSLNMQIRRYVSNWGFYSRRDFAATEIFPLVEEGHRANLCAAFLKTCNEIIALRSVSPHIKKVANNAMNEMLENMGTFEPLILKSPL